MFFRIKPVVVAGIMMVCMALAAGSFYIYFKLNVCRIFNTQVSALTNRHVEAAHIQAEFPATFLIEGLSIDGMLECPRVRVALDLLSLFNREIRIRSVELDAPRIRWEENTAVVVPEVPGQSVEVVAAPQRVRGVIVSKLLVHDGVLIIKNDGREYFLDQVQLRALRVPVISAPARTEFYLTASMIKLNVPFIGSFLKVNGWVNWYARDMDAQVQVVDDNGRVGLQAKIISRQNDMQVDGDMRLTAQQVPQAVGKKMGLMEDVVINVLSSTSTDLDLGFSFQTRMDHISMEKVHLSGQITTGLNSLATSGNIVAGLEELGTELFKMMPSSPQ
ncbi:MAG: hypothetical protein V2A70_09830 [Candidatus Omnitrophota bacterium]